ncbi:MAG TPA: hypothetical protein VFQ85_18685 [Mycobacteriales bacterium]|nr:hypothetical protein [Mycobacteriales bacterium]
MRRVLIPLALVATALAPVAPAHAAKAPKKVCNILKDPANDAGVANNALGPSFYDPTLDIVSVDLSSDGKVLTGVIRVRTLSENDNLAPVGRSWTISANAGTNTVSMAAYHSPFGQYFTTGKGSFDFTRSEIRIHVALNDIAYAKIKKGTVLRNIVAVSAVVVGFPTQTADLAGAGYTPAGGAADRAENPKVSYTVPTPSCVKPGA